MIDVERARRMMEEAGLDALVATSPENVYYSSGSARMVSRGMVIEAYDAAVKTVARAGYEFNLPFVGHSLGIALHENPFVGPSHGDWRFEPGMFFQIEPLLMYEGVRVHTEDSILVTDEGAKNDSRYADISEIQVIRKSRS